MKILLMTGLMLTASGCTLLTGAKDALSISHELGKARGRAEVIQELQENKKKLDQVKEFILLNLAETLSADKTESKELKKLIPVVMSLTLLLQERGKLLDELKSATGSESVDE